MTHTGVIMYALRLPDGRWWRRGAGARAGGPTSSFKKATLYGNCGAAKTAANKLELEERHGGYEIVECPKVIGNVVLRVTRVLPTAGGPAMVV